MKIRNDGKVYRYTSAIIFLATIVLVNACGDSGENKTATDTPIVEKTNPGGLTDWEMESGFGPVKKKLNLGPINEELSKEGEAIFDTKCITCHKLDERYTGPAHRIPVEPRHAR